MVLISRELQSLISANEERFKNPAEKKKLVIEYAKRRTFGIIFSVVVLLLLVTTSVFTDLGLNIGEAIIRFLGF